MDSYESKMLKDLSMPPRKDVEKQILLSLYYHKGSIKEFNKKVEIVDEIAKNFNLSDKQKNAYLKTVYRKENRIKRSNLWHRLLFRAADSLAKENLITRPTETYKITNKREWMITEKGFDKALILLNISQLQKDYLPIKSFEVQKFVKKIIDSPRPINYNPIDKYKKTIKISKELILRKRSFRQAVIETYEYRCAFCGLKINTPNCDNWEVEAAHIVPHKESGRDDIWNGIALCRLHHWAFDVFWFTLNDDFTILTSSKLDKLTNDYGLLGKFNFLVDTMNKNKKIILPKIKNHYPHRNSLIWHRELFSKLNR